jgi:catechol 2,3-dioxygenase-like lactoylglutathione lyase family enzyme
MKPPTLAQQRKPITRFAHITLATRDVRRSSDFFQATLGWQPIARPGNIDRDAAWLEIGPGQEIHLLEVPQFEPSAFEQEFGRHVAIYYPRDAFAELRERIVQHGGELIEPLRETPFERFFFCDPNGYVFEVIDSTRPNQRDETGGQGRGERRPNGGEAR